MFTLLLFGLFFVLLIIGVPISLCLAMASILSCLITGQIPSLVLVQKMFRGIDSFTLMAIPFFVFAGNLARVEAVNTLLRRLIAGHELLSGILTSQVISNVPAALLLSGFTDQADALILGVNIGGLGTPIASLASLISMKLYSHAEHARTWRYLAVFLIVNLVLLLLLYAAATLF